LFEIDNREAWRFVGGESLAIEESENGQPAILSAFDAVEELLASQDESFRGGVLQGGIVSGALGVIRKKFVRLFEALKCFRIAGGMIVGVKALRKRAVDALDAVTIRARTESQEFVVIRGGVFVVEASWFSWENKGAGWRLT